MSTYAAELLRRQFMGNFISLFLMLMFGSNHFIPYWKIHVFRLDLARNPPDGVSVGLGDDGNIFHWELLIVGPPETLYEGGFFNAKLEFPADFPNSPPVMTFTTPIWHPNGKIVHKISMTSFICTYIFSIIILFHAVYEDGRVCISILHPPGEDQFNQQVLNNSYLVICFYLFFFFFVIKLAIWPFVNILLFICIYLYLFVIY